MLAVGPGADRRQPVGQPVPGPDGGRRPVRGRHARVVDELPAAALQLSRSSRPISSPYPMWDKEDREPDNRSAGAGRGAARARATRRRPRRSRTPSSTRSSRCRRTPSWPPVTALTLAGVFAMLLLRHYWIAARLPGRGRRWPLLGWHHRGVAAHELGGRSRSGRPGAATAARERARRRARWSRRRRSPSPAAGGGWRCSCAPR